MPRLFIMLMLVIWSQQLFAQQHYFQQEVRYEIDVKLDDTDHILRGFETMIYVNHSPDTLRTIFMHVWPNAYKNDRSAFATQQVENRQTKFYFSKEDDKGFIDSLNFHVDQEVVNTSTYNEQEDILLLELNKPLLPGKQIEITTPFRVVIPYCFSRMGHVGQSYQISQWYPKPAVYDRNGWHPMPYLDQGEFYSEYGTYKVHITLPATYVVAATGELQDSTEKAFIESRSNLPDSTVIKTNDAVTGMKTISFHQHNVHDFAWFADKTFRIEKTTCSLSSGHTVDCYAYFHESSKKTYKGSSEVVAQTIRYLSDHVGEYPYRYASVVDGSLLAGEGMEYPMIAVMGSTNSKMMLRTVIIHEVGHNWFYGLLGSNERDHPWMDESINSLYENLISHNTEKDSSGGRAEEVMAKAMDRLNKSFLYQVAASRKLDQAIDLPSTTFAEQNYGGSIYQKGTCALNYLYAYLGDSIFDRCMKQYFREWCFKHPSPDDFRSVFQRESGQTLEWFFDDLLQQTQEIDFAFRGVTRTADGVTVKVRSRNGFKGPVPVSAMQHDSILSTTWITYPYEQGAHFLQNINSITSFRIDANNLVPELRIANNRYRNGGILHTFHPGLRLVTSIGVTPRQDVFVLPLGGYNAYDQWMFGLGLHNLKIPNHRFQFAILPLYSLRAKALNGSAFMNYRFYPHGALQEVNVTIQGRSYHHNESHLNIPSSLFLRHIKLMPAISIAFRKRDARSPVSNRLTLRYYLVGNQTFGYVRSLTDSLYRPFVQAYTMQSSASLNLEHKNNRTFNPFSYRALLNGGKNFIKASLEGNARIDYHMAGKAFYIRAFAGKFMTIGKQANVFDLQPKYLNATYGAANDFQYDQVYLARNEQQGFLSQQIGMQEGGLKVRTFLLTNPIGRNDNWLGAINVRSDLPLKLPVRLMLFADVATYANAKQLNRYGNKAIFDGGLELHLFNNMLVFYAPLIMSRELKDYVKSTYPKNRLLNTISFSLNIDHINWTNTDQLLNMFQ